MNDQRNIKNKKRLLIISIFKENMATSWKVRAKSVLQKMEQLIFYTEHILRGTSQQPQCLLRAFNLELLRKLNLLKLANS